MIDDSASTVEHFGKSDLYFFQYESKNERINGSTDRLLNFLDALILNHEEKHFLEDIGPVQIRFSAAERQRIEQMSVLPARRRYKQLVLVGHSEGGVVVRNAVIKRFKSRSIRFTHPRQWKVVMNAHLSLFAPAIAGFAPAGFLGIVMKMPLIGSVVHAFLSRRAGYQDLSGNDFLEDLKLKTEMAAQRSPHRALRADILWAYGDDIVHPTKYEEDTEEFVESDHTHICKPRLEYDHPLQFVARGLTLSLGQRGLIGEDVVEGSDIA
jgi:hypothetical protein